MHAQKWYARNPKDEKRDQSIRLDALTFIDSIVQGEKRRPDGTNHDSRCVCAVHVLDGEPENGEDGARYDGDVGAPETPGCASKHGKGHMVDHADGAVQSDDEGYHEEGKGDYAEGFAPCQALVLLVLWLKEGEETHRWR
jgi:hypothetical protein